MESLNDILLKAAQRRQQMLEQQSPEGTSPGAPQQQDQRQGQQGQILSRRPAPPSQQMSRSGQQAPYASSNQQNQRSPKSQQSQYTAPPRTRSAQGEPMPQTRRDMYTRQRSQASGSLYHQRPRPIQESQTRPTSNYYQADSYPPIVQADVVEEWEDDAADMRYGDWENEADEAEAYPHSNVERFSADVTPARREMPAPPLPTAPNIPTASNQDPRLYGHRTVRNPRVPPTQPSMPQAIPASQEARNYHRITQPLNSQAVTRVSQHIEHIEHIAQEVTHAQKPSRQLVVREQYAPALPASSAMQRGVCPKCKGAGFLRASVPYGDPNFGKAIACECKEAERKEKRRLELYEMSNLGAFRNKSFKNFNTRIPGVQEAYQMALEYAQNPSGWLVLIGPTGCGKTHLAAAIANQSLDGGAVVLFMTVIELLDHLRATFVPTSQVVYDQLFSSMREAELLVLDDLGAQQSSPWANEKLFQLLNYRYNSSFPTVITTNNKGLQGIDERVRSRMMDTGLVVTVTFDRAQDYRPHKPRRE